MFLDDVKVELKGALKNYGPVLSLHDGYAIILEELDEAWDEIKKKPSLRDNQHIYRELVQVAAMCQRTAEDLKLDE